MVKTHDMANVFIALIGAVGLVNGVESSCVWGNCLDLLKSLPFLQAVMRSLARMNGMFGDERFDVIFGLPVTSEYFTRMGTTDNFNGVKNCRSDDIAQLVCSLEIHIALAAMELS